MLLCMAVPGEQQWHKDGLEEVKCPPPIDTMHPCVCEASSDGLDFKCSNSAGRRSTNFVDVAAVGDNVQVVSSGWTVTLENTTQLLWSSSVTNTSAAIASGVRRNRAQASAQKPCD